VAFAALTWLALESGEVVVLRTFDAGGKAVDSRVWIADDETGAAWIESAEPEKAFYLRLLARPNIELVRDDKSIAVRAVPLPGDAAHARIRSMLRAKYGWRDRWIGLLIDTSRSVAVRLERIETSDPLSLHARGVS
jgi:hypothetical protein